MGIKEHLTAATLIAWRDRMGYTQVEACATLGCSRNAWRGWEEGTTTKIPRYIGLAMAALALGMSAYGDVRTDNKAVG